MQKKAVFQLFDLVIYFNVFVFIGVSITGYSENLGMAVFFFVFGLLNLIFIILTMKLRKQFNNGIEESIKLDIEAEQNLPIKDKDAFNKAKQQFLESRIETEVKAKIPEAKIIRNAYIPRPDGSTSELDLIVICKQGIFIIESKNITGKIIADWKNDKDIKIQHPGGSTFSIQNPIEQNTQHYYSLRNYLGIDSNLFRSIVVFGDQCMFDYKALTPYHAEVCKLDKLIESMNRIANRYKTILEDHMVQNIYENLMLYVTEDEYKRDKHINNLSK